MLTGKAKEDFEVWFYQTYKHNYTFYQQKENSKILMMITVDWFNDVGATEIGGYSISDIIYTKLQSGLDLFNSMHYSIKEANNSYNNINN